MLIFNEEMNTICTLFEDKSYNYNEEYVKKYRVNRVLSRMERYFRKHHLLEKGEMLEIFHTPQRHLRVEFVECIARKEGWIYSDEFLHIITH